MSLSCVMIVDDSEADQYICVDTIEHYDPSIKILQAYDGQEAIEILETTEQKPEVIFLDINMPRMDGHEFLAIYDAMEEEASVVIMLTSSEQKKDQDRSMAYKSVKSYLTKPLEAKNLEDAANLLS